MSKKKLPRRKCFFCLKPAMKQGIFEVKLTENITRSYAICVPCSKRPQEYLVAACLAHEGCEILMADAHGKRLTEEAKDQVIKAINLNMDIVLRYGGDGVFLPEEYKLILANQRMRTL